MRAFDFPSVAPEEVPLRPAQTRFVGLAKRVALWLKKVESSKPAVPSQPALGATSGRAALAGALRERVQRRSESKMMMTAAAMSTAVSAVSR